MTFTSEISEKLVQDLLTPSLWVAWLDDALYFCCALEPFYSFPQELTFPDSLAHRKEERPYTLY
jgi:hypothetical protein